jgi:hypothetical protein
MRFITAIFACLSLAVATNAQSPPPPQPQKINHPPKIVSYAPKELGAGRRQELFHFSVKAVDPDGDSLSYSWMLNGALLSTDPKFEFTFGSTGRFTLTAVVTDGQAADSVQWNVMVTDTAVYQNKPSNEYEEDTPLTPDGDGGYLLPGGNRDNASGQNEQALDDQRATVTLVDIIKSGT